MADDITFYDVYLWMAMFFGPVGQCGKEDVNHISDGLICTAQRMTEKMGKMRASVQV